MMWDATVWVWCECRASMKIYKNHYAAFQKKVLHFFSWNYTFAEFTCPLGSVALLWHNEKVLALSESAKRQVWVKMLKIA